MPRRYFLPLALLGSMLWVSSCVEPTKVVSQAPCEDCAPTSEDQLIQLFSETYQNRDIEKFTNLFSTSSDGVPYSFILNAPVNGIDSWDLDEELRIHRRMFAPDAPLPGETPVQDELWLVSITINLSRTTATWGERTDLYKTPTNPDGIDATKWLASEAEYHADILLETQGETDYRVDGRMNFILLEDRAKTRGEARKFLIYRCEDLEPPPAGPTPAGVNPATLTSVKNLYR